MQKKQGSDKVFKKTRFLPEDVLVNLFTDEIFYIIKRKHFLKNAVVEIAVRHRSERSFYVLDKI